MDFFKQVFLFEDLTASGPQTARPDRPRTDLPGWRIIVEGETRYGTVHRAESHRSIS